MRDRPGRGVENLLRRMAICREYCAAHKRGDSPPVLGGCIICQILLHIMLRPALQQADLPGQDTERFARRRRIYNAHPGADGGLRGHVPARPGWSHTSYPDPVRRPARLDWASSRPHRSAELTPKPRGDALALLLAFGSARTWREDFHLARSVACLAHTHA